MPPPFSLKFLLAFSLHSRRFAVRFQNGFRARDPRGPILACSYRVLSSSLFRLIARCRCANAFGWHLALLFWSTFWSVFYLPASSNGSLSGPFYDFPDFCHVPHCSFRGQICTNVGNSIYFFCMLCAFPLSVYHRTNSSEINATFSRTLSVQLMSPVPPPADVRVHEPFFVHHCPLQGICGPTTIRASLREMSDGPSSRNRAELGPDHFFWDTLVRV